jgi:hypothetical protein
MAISRLLYAPKKTFHVTLTNILIAQNKSMASIVNAGGSGVIVKIQEIRLVNSRTAATTGVVADFQLKRITGHSAGTNFTPVSSDSADTLSGSVTVKTGATVAGESAANMKRAQWSSDEWGPGTVDVEAQDHTQQLTGEPLYSVRPEEKPITLRPGEGMSLKQVANSVNGTFDIFIVFTEEAA